MPFKDNLASSDAQVKRKLSEPYRMPTGYDAFSVTVGQAIDEDIASSEAGFSTMDMLPWAGDIPYTHNDDRSDRIKDHMSAGDIPENYLDNFTSRDMEGRKTVDYNAASLAINDEFDFDEKFKSTEELHELRKIELDKRREYAQQVQSRYDGWFAPLVGGFVGFGTDPLIAVGSAVAPAFYSASVAAKMSRSALALSMTKRGALIGAGLQIPVEPYIHSWKEDIGVDYTLIDSMFNIAAAGLFNGAIDGFASAIAGPMKVKTPKGRISPEIIEKLEKMGIDAGQAEDIVIFTHQADQHPNGDTPVKEVIGEMDKVVTEMNTPVFHDNSPYIGVEDELTLAFDAIKDDVIFDTPSGKMTAAEMKQLHTDDIDMFNEFIGCIVK